jgi:hypothetical protein
MKEPSAMTHDSHHFPSMFRIDVSAEAAAADSGAHGGAGAITVALLRQMVAGQERQNRLLEELIHLLSGAQRQRVAELGQWKEANPGLARNCREAAETLGRVQTQFLRNLTREIAENEECLVDGDFMLNEFVDRYGPRLAHLNGVLQVLSQLSSMPTPTNTAQ